MTSLSNIGLIGLAVMGENLVLNMAHHDFSVSVYNRTYAKTQKFLDTRAKGLPIQGFDSISDFCASLEKPRKIVILVKAGEAVDEMINALVPHLEKDDIIIDGGNSNFEDTRRRSSSMPNGILFMGCGVSGGEEGALKGPSLMPAGPKKAYDAVAPILTAIAAKAPDGTPCCAYLSTDGAGHYVKMVHNGIEYADMQLISEVYLYFKSFGFPNALIATIFSRWNETELNSYLIEITAHILKQKDSESSHDLIDMILDVAGQKGTGKWTVIDALHQGVPSPMIAEAVFARSLSAQYEMRQSFVAKNFRTMNELRQDHADDEIERIVSCAADALYAAKASVYAQGFSQIQTAKKTYNWPDLDCGTVASLWRGGCIIRASFLNDITLAFQKDSTLENLLLSDHFFDKVKALIPSSQFTMACMVWGGLPTPALSSAFTYLMAMGYPKLPTNLIQAQRDYFGAHMYERTDKPRGEYFHTDWLNLGGDTTSSAYNN